MKLTQKQVEELKQFINTEIEKGEPMHNAATLHNLFDTIEAQWQEIQRLRVQMIQAARGSAEIVDLAAENVKLQSQNAVLREALEEATETIENIYERDTKQTVRFRKVMEDEPADYHNPADTLQISGLQIALKKAEDRWTKALSDNDGTGHNPNDIAKIEHLEEWSKSLEINRDVFSGMVKWKDADIAAMRDTLETAKQALKMGMQDSKAWDIKQKIIATIDRILATDIVA